MEYRIAKGWRIFVYITTAIFSIIGIGMLFHAFQPGAAGDRIFFMVLGFFMFAIVVPVCVDTIRLVFTVDERAVTLLRLFVNRRVLLKDIEGYRNPGKSNIFLYMKNGGKKMQVPRYIGNRDEVVAWFKENYEDLDMRERALETQTLLASTQFGFTKEERKERLDAGKKLDRTASVAGLALVFWALFDPQPYELFMILTFVLPWLAIGVTWYYKGLIKLYKKKSSPYPSVVQFICMAIFATLIPVLKEYLLYGFDGQAWSILIGATFLGGLICIIVCRPAIVGSSRKILTYSGIFIMAALYSYSLLIFSNCHYDRSQPEIWEVAVKGKRVSSGRSTEYYLSLSPWGRYTNGDEVSVPQETYNGFHVDDSVRVYLKKGKLGVPWYWLGK